MNFFEHKYVMVECLVYFEPYYSVLQAIQNMSEEKFPMQEYIVDIRRAPQYPKYVSSNTTYFMNGYRVPITRENTWPSATTLQLNQSQYSAFKAALTNKFVVIQGPPGTGKTFLGLKIVETLIANEHEWYKGNPILVVCMTNHALDQFLEGIAKVTNRIVRVGGQSKSEVMQQHNLKEKRKTISCRRHIDIARRNVKRRLRSYLDSVQILSNKLQSLSNYNAINFNQFNDLVDEYSNSWFGNALDEDILHWLYQYSSSTERQLLEHKFAIPEVGIHEHDSNEDYDDILHEQNPNELLLDLGNEGYAGPGTSFKYTLDITDLTREILILEKKCKHKKNSTALQNELYEMKAERQFLQICLAQAKLPLIRSKPRNCDLKHPYTMSLEDRWNLYFYWLQESRHKLMKQLIEHQSKYRTTFSQVMELQDMEDIFVMQQMLVVGMTTTGAARHQKTLQALHSRIVVVEEAAEVLESHIIVSLTKNCEHLLLLGDHKQLRPSTADYNLAKTQNLDISLFERMVINKIDCHTLLVQHRMRPLISKLITPAIYANLQDAAVVKTYPSIIGLTSPLFFLSHSYPEVSVNRTSKSNLHEAKFFIALAKYMIECGYQPQDITILAAYSGQMIELGAQRRKHGDLLKNVRITVLDNYQGEENKIIFLSLVRNNNEGKIGFLKMENRVCVALSRAKEALYIMGNMPLLCSNSEIWKKIKFVLTTQNCYGRALQLQCINGLHKIENVSVAEDFKTIDGGVCKKLCNVRMNCGHNCDKTCHKLGVDHSASLCEIPVEDRCSNNHRITRTCFKKSKCMTNCPKMNKQCSTGTHGCPLKCYEECKSCNVLVKKVTIDCKHEVMVPCNRIPNRLDCSKRCPIALACGHPCKQRCNQRCTVKCTELIDNPFPSACGHKFKIECYLRENAINCDDIEIMKFCNKPCDSVLLCSHKCQGTCYTCCQGRIHVLCMAKTERYLICGHKSSISCSRTQDLCLKRCSYRCKHTVCSNACTKPCLICPEACERKCAHVQCTLPCGEICNVPPCTKPCPLLLSCGHPCIGFCGDPCPTLCGICDFNDIQEIHFEFKPTQASRFIMLDECKHVIESNRMEAWLKKNSSEISYKSCPKCYTPLTCTKRYTHLLKKAKLNIDEVWTKPSRVQYDVNSLNKVFERLLPLVRNFCIPRDLLEKVRRSCTDMELANSRLLQSRQLKLYLLNKMVHFFELESFKYRDSNLLSKCLNAFLLKLQEVYLSEQRLSDLQWELRKFLRLLQMLKIRECYRFNLQDHNTKQLYDRISKHFDAVTAYTTSQDVKVANDMKKLCKTVGVNLINHHSVLSRLELRMYPERWFKCPNGHFNLIFANDSQLKTQYCFECNVPLLTRATCTIL